MSSEHIINLFFSHSYRDRHFRRKLEKHLAVLQREGLIADWHDREIAAGDEWKSEIDRHLLSADIVLLLVTADFIASDYCWSEEIKKVLERHQRGEARVIPVILKPCSWGNTPFGGLQAVPKSARPVTSWPSQDEAFEDVAVAIKRAVEDMRGESDREAKRHETAESEEEPKRSEAQVREEAPLRRVKEEQKPLVVKARALKALETADELASGGRLGEALHLLRNEALPACEQIGDILAKAATLGRIAEVLQARGELDEALRILREVLAIYEQVRDPASTAMTYHQLGNVSYLRADYDAALYWIRKSLAIEEQLGNRAGTASSYHQLGNVSYLRGDLDAALDWTRKSLTIKEQLGDRAGMATSYRNLGSVSFQRGDYDAALDWYHKALAIDEQLGDRAGMAGSYHQLGIVAQARGDTDAALAWYHKSLAISEKLGDRAGMASSYHQLGVIAQDRGDYDVALDWYRRSLAILRELGDRTGMASTLSQIGILYTQTGRAYDAVPLTLQSFALHDRMQSPYVRTDLLWLSRQRQTLGADAFRAIVAEHCDAESMTHVLALLDEFDRTQASAADPEHPRQA